MNCKQCNTVIDQAGNRAKEYCSDKCRMAYKRSIRTESQSEQVESEQIQSEQGLTEQVLTQSEQGPILYGDDPINRQYKHGDTVTLSDGQTFVRDTTARDRLRAWARADNGTQGVLGWLAACYEIIRPPTPRTRGA